MKKERTEKDSKKKKRLKDKISVKSDNEKQYNITLKGLEKAKAESMDIAGIKAERLGIKYAYETAKNPEVLELESDIAYYENKIHEKQLELKAFIGIMEELKEELAKLNDYVAKKKRIQKKVYKLYSEFLEDGFSDITDFYSVNNKYYADLDIIRMKEKLNSFEELVEIFEEYLQELEEKTALDSSTDVKTKGN